MKCQCSRKSHPGTFPLVISTAAEVLCSQGGCGVGSPRCEPARVRPLDAFPLDGPQRQARAFGANRFELPQHAPRPYYRAGMEFTDAAVQADVPTLLAGALKFDGVFSVQAKGDGPVRALVFWAGPKGPRLASKP